MDRTLSFAIFDFKNCVRSAGLMGDRIERSAMLLHAMLESWSEEISNHHRTRLKEAPACYIIELLSAAAHPTGVRVCSGNPGNFLPQQESMILRRAQRLQRG